jgi:hypothetical protein
MWLISGVFFFINLALAMIRMRDSERYGLTEQMSYLHINQASVTWSFYSSSLIFLYISAASRAQTAGDADGIAHIQA